MARWRLVAPHYLNVPGTEWEYKETDRSTGRQKKTLFPVPTHLDPDQPADWTHRTNDGGEIVVCYKGKGDDKDLIFNGPPTPDMVPLDAEAKAISASFAKSWKHPIESLTGSYSDEILKDLGKEMDSVRAAGNKPAQIEGMAELLTAMTQMMKQNQELLTTMVARDEPKARRA